MCLKKVVLLLVYVVFVGNLIAQDKIVVFSKTEGFRHSSIEVGVKSIINLGAKHNLKIVST